MKIAITADFHLGSKKDYPSRYNALENILEQITEKKINSLIIAGDLFDENCNHYVEFDKIASKYRHITFHVIPGNHDAAIDNKTITSKNVEIYSSPSIKKLDESGLHFFFVPYQKCSVMGEILASKAIELAEKNWILIGHGDWESGIKTSNPLEPGVYMPLCKKDINLFKPTHVFLGHIHKPFDEDCLCYPGSPCGLDITETGKRRFLIYDTEKKGIEINYVDTDMIYHLENISILPLKDEESYLRDQIKKIVKGWDLQENDKKKVHIRIKIRGYSSDLRKLKEIVHDEFKDFCFYNGEDIDLSEVFRSDNYDLEEIARKTAEKIQEIWPVEAYPPTYDEVLFHALKTIYGGK